MRFFARISLLMWASCLLVFASVAQTQTPETQRLIFSGFGYAVDYVDIGTQFPNSSSALADVDLDRTLMDDLTSAIQPYGLQIVGDELGVLGEGQSAYVLALVLEDERVSQTKIDGQYKVVINLAYSAQVFDFDRKELIASFPRRIVYIDYQSNRPNPQYLKGIFAKLIAGETGSVRSGFWEAVSKMRLPDASTRRIRISSVTLPSGFEWAIGSDPSLYANNLGRLMSSAIGEASAVAVLPYSNNQVLSGKMASRIANAEVFNFSIPEEDYAIAINFTGFKKVPVKANGAGEVSVYGAYADFALREPLSGKVLYNASMKHGESKTIPRGAIQSSDVESMQRVGELFLSGLAVAIATDDEKWERTHLANKTSKVGSLRTVKEILDQCR